MFSQQKFPPWQRNFPRIFTHMYEKPLSCFATVSIHLPLFTRQNIMVFYIQYSIIPNSSGDRPNNALELPLFPLSLPPPTWVGSTKSAACASVLRDSWFLSSTSEQLLTRAHLHRTLKRDRSSDSRGGEGERGRVSWAPWATDAFPATSAVDFAVSFSFVVVDIICN